MRQLVWEEFDQFYDILSEHSDYNYLQNNERLRRFQSAANIIIFVHTTSRSNDQLANALGYWNE